MNAQQGALGEGRLHASPRACGRAAMRWWVSPDAASIPATFLRVTAQR